MFPNLEVEFPMFFPSKNPFSISKHFPQNYLHKMEKVFLTLIKRFVGDKVNQFCWQIKKLFFSRLTFLTTLQNTCEMTRCNLQNRKLFLLSTWQYFHVECYYSILIFHCIATLMRPEEWKMYVRSFFFVCMKNCSFAFKDKMSHHSIQKAPQEISGGEQGKDMRRMCHYNII